METIKAEPGSVVVDHGVLKVTRVFGDGYKLVVYENPSTGFIFYESNGTMIPDECSVLKMKASAERVTAIGRSLDEKRKKIGEKKRTGPSRKEVESYLNGRSGN